ncbi:endonuclease/exonuclease/phosphatase family protein [Vibrio europaeus]|uniref:Endonuclease n=1 Tax=Vibrio europaeus TaxID=300876 RepID=A0A178J6L3_9VIBR|nr:endonuclease/exonuclease/phosphatase family protein [Vibrio europaeus]MDC5705342.1 endonuclease/exonuclease/phosphatase family protein [Vibrio europaeus]MDC5710621.1 endonuclease/exonuclease/phosphatase family protein [Vibrio europaeus]MDC5715711.1 endonuclease/exonuclease/phosphatase family protein [Vibrio europaeus]MDC5719872.1 endonuclease/exonuclease/phosphatase family protein [Vibrio europaeus]MDC5724240.1 endonuclease/exonuclease/phosphatase family protein [Vibrio europaeus]
MLTNKTLSFATANLFNFVEPPQAFYDFENIYDGEAWQEKCRWTQEKLTSLNADIVGVQEVFSIDAARRLFEELGYPHFAVVDEPNLEQDYICSQPVVAIASRYPIISVSAVTPPSSIEECYQVKAPDFSRKPICATVDVPDIGEVAVYVCHLKSQRPTDSLDAEKSHSLVGQWLSSQQRGWEALMLRLFMEQQYNNHPIPTVLMGDMNQTINSNITGLLTQQVNESDKQLRLRDSWQLQSASAIESERPPTHYHFSKGNVLDYILLSQEFQPGSQYSMADVTGYQTLDTHLINPSFDKDKQASDHAFVAVTVQFVL